MNTNRKLNGVLWILIVLIILTILFVCGGFIYSAIFAHPQPEYSVESFSQLQEKLEQAEEVYLLPDAGTVQELGFGASYTVYLKDRFHDDPSGYYLCIYTAENYAESFTVDCRLLEMYEETSRPTVQPNDVLGGVGIHTAEMNGGRVTFIYNGCYYDIQSESIEHSKQIAKSILDKAA